MDPSSSDIDINKGIIVFSTSKTLNERFTSDQPGCIFIVNNGYTRHHTNSTITGRITFENEFDANIDKLFTSYTQSNTGDGEAKTDESSPKNLKEKPDRSTKRRRVVLLPVKPETPIKNDGGAPASGSTRIEAKASGVNSNRRMEPSNRRWIKPVDSKSCAKKDEASAVAGENRSACTQPTTGKATRKRPKKSSKQRKSESIKRIREQVKKQCDEIRYDLTINTRFMNNGQRGEPIVFSPFLCKSPSGKPTIYKWRSVMPSKAQLDEELDSYMSAKRSKLPVPEPKEVVTHPFAGDDYTEDCLENEDVAKLGMIF